MPEETQQNSNAGAEPAQQPLVSPPPQPSEPAAVPFPESPTQEPPAQQTGSEIQESQTGQAEPDAKQPAEQGSVETISSQLETPQEPTPVSETRQPEQQEPPQPAIEPATESDSTTEQSNQSIETSIIEAPEPPVPQSREPKETIVERVRELNESEKEELFKSKLKSLSPKGVSARRGKRQANYDKIIAHLKTHGYIANDEVEKICRVKDSTARKYLNDLEKQGTLLQIGSRGRRVRYRLMQGNQ